VDTALYGNAYPLDEMLPDLTAAIFAADQDTSVNAFRRNLQAEYVDRLGRIVTAGDSDGFDTSAQAMALYELDQLATMLSERPASDTVTQAHTRYLSLKIEAVIEALKRA